MTPFYMIHLREFRTAASIGFHDIERRGSQPIVFSVVLILPEKYEFRDHISSVVDYDIVRQTINTHIADHHWDLLESLCGTIAEDLIENDGVLGVIIRGAKTKAYPDTEAVSCHLARLSPALGDNFPWWTFHV